MHFPPISTQSLCKTLQQAKGMRGFLVHAEKNPQFLPISPHFLPNLCPNSCCKAQRVPGFFWCMQQNPHFRPFSTLVLIQNLSQAKQPRGFLVHAAKKKPISTYFLPNPCPKLSYEPRGFLPHATKSPFPTHFFTQTCCKHHQKNAEPVGKHAPSL